MRVEEEGDLVIDITGSYNSEAASKKLSVKFEWTVPEFEYVVNYKWNESRLENEIDTAGWSDNYVKITVTNNSNQSVKAAFAWTAAEKVTVVNVTGKFTEDAAGVTALPDNTLVLDSAEPTGGAVSGEAKSKEAYFFITGGYLTETHSGTIGNITITIGAND